MKNYNISFKYRFLSLLLSLAFLVSITGLAPTSAFAREKKKFNAEVEFQIELLRVMDVDIWMRAIGDIRFMGTTKKGKVFEGVGAVMFSILDGSAGDDLIIDTSKSPRFVAQVVNFLGNWDTWGLLENIAITEINYNPVTGNTIFIGTAMLSVVDGQTNTLG